MELAPDVFDGASDRFKRHGKLFDTQNFLGKASNRFFDEYKDSLKVKEGEDRNLSILVGAALGKGLKTFQAVSRLCLLGYGEDSLVLLRSNANLLINVAYILSRDNPNEWANNFLEFSNEERAKYFKTVFDIDDPSSKPSMPMEEHDRRVRCWKDVRIADRARAVPGLHYNECYRFYSSFEHSDASAINEYIKYWDEKGPRIGSGPSDKHIELALTHNFMVFTDLLMCVCKYYGIDRPDIFSELSGALSKATKGGDSQPPDCP